MAEVIWFLIKKLYSNSKTGSNRSLHSSCFSICDILTVCGGNVRVYCQEHRPVSLLCSEFCTGITDSLTPAWRFLLQQNNCCTQTFSIIGKPHKKLRSDKQQIFKELLIIWAPTKEALWSQSDQDIFRLNVPSFWVHTDGIWDIDVYWLCCIGPSSSLPSNWEFKSTMPCSHNKWIRVWQKI